MNTAWAWDFPTPAPVVDEVGLLQRQEVQHLSDILSKIKKNSGVEISIYIPRELGGQDIASFSIAAAEHWKLGNKKEDKGLIFIVAPREKKMRFEVGYGLEGDITDAFSKRVLDTVVRPQFKQGNYYNGILYGIAAIQEKIPLGLEEEDLPAEKIRFSPALILVLFIVLIFVLRFLGALQGYGNRYSRRGGWGGGGFGGSSWGGGGWSSKGGSSWGGGGGGFGGGGASSDW